MQLHRYAGRAAALVVGLALAACEDAKTPPLAPEAPPSTPAAQSAMTPSEMPNAALALERSITSHWQISAGYALQDADVTKTTTAAPAGSNLPLVPKHSFSLWNRYDLNGRVGAGLGVIARSKSDASISNTVTLPAYTRLDGALFYKLPNGMEAQVNLENILGADYFSAAHNDNNIAPGAPRTLKATVGYRF